VGPGLTGALGNAVRAVCVDLVREFTPAVYAAHFVEVHVDPDLGTIRVARVVSAVDGGRILNPKTARSQIIGGIAGGIGMAGMAAAVANAVHHATGVRVRSLPISIEKMLGHETV
jgi:CO/xanthine dehydrogenase Mo-binding subunit